MLTLNSSDFVNGSTLPDRFTCHGVNLNPALKISGVPANAKSLVLILDDPDAPVGVFTHWLVWNIDPSTTDIAENSLPSKSVVGTNDAGKNQYVGPCPPSGTHHYFFRLSALDTTLNLPSSAKVADLTAAIKDHLLETTTLMGKYGQ